MTSQTEISTVPPVAETPMRGRRWFKIAQRLATILVVTYCWGWFVNRSVTSANARPEPPGFAIGVLHGAIMPGAILSLFTGKDVVIYAEHNSGRMYKLGYTFGVNACGAFFFGLFYWRLNRLRKRYAARN